MELKNNQGILFQNNKTKDTQPDFKGELNVDGEILQIAIWERKSKNGNSYLSALVEHKKEEHKKEPEKVGDYLDQHKDNFTPYDNLNDDIPF